MSFVLFELGSFIDLMMLIFGEEMLGKSDSSFIGADCGSPP